MPFILGFVPLICNSTCDSSCMITLTCDLDIVESNVMDLDWLDVSGGRRSLHKVSVLFRFQNKGHCALVNKLSQ